MNLPTHQRTRFRMPRIWYVLCAVFLFLLVCVYFFPQSGLPTGGLVIAGNPTVVAWWSKEERTLTLLTIPSDITIDAVHGYGRYALASLWKLGAIEKNDGALLSQSLEETLAIPIPWFIGSKQAMEQIDAAETILRRVVSVPSFMQILGRSLLTNMPLTTYLKLLQIVTFLPGDKVITIDGAKSNTFATETLPDTSTVRSIDLSRLDVLFGDIWEESGIRKEAVNVTVYNTTATPLLGQRVARLLGHMGAVVVTVGNQQSPVEGCVMSGDSKFKHTETAKFIERHFGCIWQDRSEDIHTDVVVRIGKTYEQRFLPVAKEK